MVISLKWTTALNISILYALFPAATLALSIGDKSSITWRTICPIFLAILSTLMIISNGNLSTLLNIDLNIGDLIYLLAIVGLSAYVIESKHLVDNTSRFSRVLIQLFLTCIWVGAYCISGFEEFHCTLSYDSVMQLGLLTTLSTLFPLYAVQSAVLTLSPRQVAGFTSLGPVIGLGIEWIRSPDNIEISVLCAVTISCISVFILLSEKSASHIVAEKSA